ncbi:MAG: helix-turn-helix domain-containing protein, partial [Spongiibacter sp.]|nr:helix-turn-helix domain-containing protein [Spongiibacter sp.]
RLIERFMGMDIAKLSAATLLLDNQALDQTVYLREEKGDNHHDPAVVKVKVMLERRLSDDIALESLAADLGMSYRTLIRRFKRATNDTPLHYLQRLRINAAKRLLENSNMPIESLMQEVGYQDLSSFSKLFQRETGLTPSSYRRQARARS